MERGFGAGVSLVKLSIQFLREHYVLMVINLLGSIPALIFARLFIPYALKHFLIHDSKYRLNMHVLGKGVILKATLYQYAVGGTLPPTYPRAFDGASRNVSTRRVS